MTEPISAPQPECDLVMRGGITSGVVYPPAIAQLSRRYRFRSIGGASAGAIAAGAAAAAEWGRRNARNPQSFTRLATLSDEVGQLLASLFVPCPSARPPFRLFMLALRFGKSVSAEGEAHTWGQRILLWIRSAFRLVGYLLQAGWILGTSYPLQALMGALPAIFFAVVGLLFMQGMPPWLSVAFWLVVAGLWVVFEGLFLTLRLKRALLRDMAETHFGMCSGMEHGAHPNPNKPTLTRWLHATYQDLAGKPLDEVLTFGDLFGPPGRNAPEIELRVMTTDLTRGRPCVMPFSQELYWWRPDEFASLFPAEVIAAMQKPEYDAGDGYYKLPPAEALPVIVAVRMSLSFPLLLWAVPLHAIDYTEPADEEGKRPFRRLWFSDGGICSNFPIHFFDSPWPTRPTFGITLAHASGPKEDAPGKAAPKTSAPSFPQPAGEGILRSFRSIEGIGGFFGSVIDTMKDWQDNLQSTLPGYRERIATVELSADEGGLNLDMPPALVNAIAARGDEAGKALLNFDFEDHRWRRHLVWLGQLQRMLEVGQHRYGYDPQSGETRPEIRPGVPTLRHFLEDYGARAAHYAHDPQRREDALANLDALVTAAEAWRDILHERPDPKGRLRPQNFPHPAVTVRQVPADELPRFAAEVGEQEG